MKTFLRSSDLSKTAFLILCITILISRFLLPRFLTFDVLSIISWDVFGYYLYLPAAFLHHDLGLKDFAWVQHILDTYHPTMGFYQAYPGPAGDYVMKYPMGLALLYSPFFLAGHFFALICGFPRDGFSLPYQVSLAMGGIVYAAIGLWFLRKILIRYFTPVVTALILFITVLGTNYFELTAFDGTMPHNYLFTIYALIVWLTIRWHEDPRWKYAIPIGLLCGLSILVRPTAGIIVLVPLLWNLGDRNSLAIKRTLIRRNIMQVVIMILCLFLVVSFQLVYWKVYAGSWLYYSYEKGEKLQFLAPYLWKVLFSYKKGWLVYTPVLIFALLGFIPLFHRIKNLFLSIFIFFLAHLLIIASWPTWWYGGSLSQRAMMESYLLLAFPLGAFIQWIRERKPAIRTLTFLMLTLLVILNLFQTWQYLNFILDPVRMTKKYYWTVFGKTTINKDDLRYLEPPETNEKEFLADTSHFKSRKLAAFSFEQPDPDNPGLYCKDTANSGSYSLRLSRKADFSPAVSIPYKDLSKKDFVWIRSTGFVYFTCKPEDVKCSLVITCNHKGTAFKYRMLELEKENLKPGHWNLVTMDYQTPYFEDRDDLLQSYFWYRGEKQVLVDDFEVTVFEPGQ